MIGNLPWWIGIPVIATLWLLLRTTPSDLWKLVSQRRPDAEITADQGWVDRAREIVKECGFSDYSFKVNVSSRTGAVYLQATYVEADTRTGAARFTNHTTTWAPCGASARKGRYAMSNHVYLSTACFHEDHDHCRRACEFCAQPCSCTCHQVVTINDVVRALTAAQDEDGLYRGETRNLVEFVLQRLQFTLPACTCGYDARNNEREHDSACPVHNVKKEPS